VAVAVMCIVAIVVVCLKKRSLATTRPDEEIELGTVSRRMAGLAATSLPNFSQLPEASMLPMTRPAFSTFALPTCPPPANVVVKEEPYYSMVTRLFGVKKPTHPPPPPPLPLPPTEIKLRKVGLPVPARPAPPPPSPTLPPPLPPRNVSTHIYEEPDLGARPKTPQPEPERETWL
jgi:hypothetical protein